MKPIRTPLTIVGIVGNTVAIVLVCVVLYSDPQSKLPMLQQLVDRVKEVAKTRRVIPDDFVILLGKNRHKELYGNDVVGEWILLTDAVTGEYSVTVAPPQQSGKYRVYLYMKLTYRSGPRYVYENIARAFYSGNPFPMGPYIDARSDTLILDALK